MRAGSRLAGQPPPSSLIRCSKTRPLPDFSLSDASPCIGAGDPPPPTPIAFGGTPFASTPDVGCYSRLSGRELDFGKEFLGMTFHMGVCASFRMWPHQISDEELIELSSNG